MTPTPNYWQYETSGILRPAIEAYIAGGPMTRGQILAVRAYLRQWITGDFRGPRVDELRRDVNSICSRADIAKWIRIAVAENMDPL